MNGILNIYKEKGFTSHDVVAIIRKLINQKKVGHTGTLDPDAEGVLPICLGKATKISDYIMSEKKGYRAEITLGITTTTQDLSGEIIEINNVDFDKEKIQKAIYSFIGSYEQTPPMYSAIKINGKKLYELAREGKEIQRNAREVKIYDIKIVGFLPQNKILIDVFCSKGTYIRTLCSDIGKKLGYGAVMSYLLRTSSGNFTIDNSIKINELKNLVNNNAIDKKIITIDEVLNNYNKIYVSSKATKLLYNGGKIYECFFYKKDNNIMKEDKVKVYDSEGIFIGIFGFYYDNIKKSNYIKPIKILL